MKKRLLGLVLTLLPLLAQADPVLIDGIYYNLSGTQAEVTNKFGGSYCTNSYSGTVNIPEIVYNSDSGAYYSVTSIGKLAFNECRSLTSVNIPSSITSIGYSAFRHCSGLKSITIPNSVTSIGDCAFMYCSGLTSVNIPSSVTSIGEEVFEFCSNLISITVASGNTVYDSRNNCNAIIETSSNTLIVGCKETVIPNSVTSIGKIAFGNCEGLTSVTIPESVISIGEGAFMWCDNLTSAIIGNGVTTIDDGAFEGCSRLTSLTIGESVTTIGEDAFSDTGLTSLTILCPTVGEWFKGNTDIKELTFGDKVTKIGDYAFYNCSGLTSLNIPNGVTSIGENAFTKCTGLTSVTIPKSVTTISPGVFAYCSGLTSVLIPSSVTAIGSFAFQYCSGLTSVIIPESVASIGENAFFECTSLTSVSVLKTSPVAIAEYTFNNRYNATLYVPQGSKSTYERADYWGDFDSIVEIDFENQIFFADENVRKLCVNRYWDTDSNGWLSYEEAAAVTKLDEVFTYDEDITSFDELQYFTGLTSISRSAFCECRSLTSVIIPNTVTEIGPHAFIDCSSLASVTIPEGVTIIYYSAFDGCSSLTSVTIPNSVTEICDDAFSDCSSLTSVTIGSGVTSIGEGTFAKCSSLTDVYCYAENVPSTDSYVFYNTDIQSATLHVPASALDAYSYTAPWSEFGSKVALDDNSVATGIMDVADVPVRVKSRGGIITVEGIDNRTPVSVYTMDGMLAGTGTTTDRTATISTSLTPGTPVIVKMGGKAVKTIVR